VLIKSKDGGTVIKPDIIKRNGPKKFLIDIPAIPISKKKHPRTHKAVVLIFGFIFPIE